MKTKLLTLIVAMTLFCLPSQAQWVTFDPGNLAQGIVNTTKQIVETSTTAKNMISNFKEVQKVYNQGKEYYDALKSVNNLLKDAKKVRNTILLVGEISDIYVNSFQKMMSDPNFSIEELTAIAHGYTVLLEGSADMLVELKDVVNVNGLSMSDAERIDIISYVHDRLKRQRDLVSYYTRKNISVSYLRAKKQGDIDRVAALYGNANDRYW